MSGENVAHGSPAVAAQWLADNWEVAVSQPLTAVLRERYGYDFRTSVKVIAEARKIRGGHA